MLAAKTTLLPKSPHFFFSGKSNGFALWFHNSVPVKKFDAIKRCPVSTHHIISNRWPILTARPSPNASQLGFVGEIASIDLTIIRLLVGNNHIPVIAYAAADATGQKYNINADTAAALSAEKLIPLTDVAGILENQDDPMNLVKEVDIKGFKKMVEDGKIVGWMIREVSCCVRKSLPQGVRTASIIDCLLKELEHDYRLDSLLLAKLSQI